MPESHYGDSWQRRRKKPGDDPGERLPDNDSMDINSALSTLDTNIDFAIQAGSLSSVTQRQDVEERLRNMLMKVQHIQDGGCQSTLVGHISNVLFSGARGPPSTSAPHKTMIIGGQFTVTNVQQNDTAQLHKLDKMLQLQYIQTGVLFGKADHTYSEYHSITLIVFGHLFGCPSSSG
ncbi:hypothetical protein CVT24_006831 [Panaeolus cyanescens]|uniref:Uncharacterized protein n=1 Tax=Panaeolus cyanescens TaxID=181874 RepID=A0A409YRW5_9AGAR|nr:hypothetical protein CVT24_006831 [Panaeolus cyanescens]